MLSGRRIILLLNDKAAGKESQLVKEFQFGYNLQVFSMIKKR